MSALRVSTASRRSDLRDFVRVGETVYADDAEWVAPMRAARRLRLWRKLRSDPVQFRLLIARRAGLPVGCAAVFRDAKHDAHKDENVVFFGYFDAVDEASGDAVLDACRSAALELGGEMLRGPRGITRIDERGVLVEAREPAPMMAGHHPLWYQGFFEERGFVQNHDALAYDIALHDPDGGARELPTKLTDRAAAVDIPGLEVHACRWSHLISDIDLAHTVMVEGFRDVPDNTPLPRSTFRALGLGLLGFTDREMLQIATANGKAAAFALCFPELNEALLHARGALGPRGLIGFGRGYRGMRTASFKLLGVVPEFRGTGIHALVIKHAIEGVQRAGYRRLEASLIDSRNGPMRHVVESSGMEIYRRYRVYESAL